MLESIEKGFFLVENMQNINMSRETTFWGESTVLRGVYRTVY